MFRLLIYTALQDAPGGWLRRRLPGAYPTASEAALAGVRHLHAHPAALGFEIEPSGLAQAHASAQHAQRVQRAISARHARRERPKV